jgi:hypothetical protein
VYSDDEVKAILSRAIDKQRAAKPEGLTHDELLAVAKDAGISLEAVEAAAADVAAADVARGRDERAEELAVRQERASDFRIHLLTYVPVMAFLVFINVMTTHYPWVLWPLAGWGLALVLHWRFALHPTDVEIADEARERAERRRRREEKQRRREAKSAMQEGARELGHAVERGVATILSSTAKRIHEELDAVDDPRAPRTRVAGEERRAPSEDESMEDEDPSDARREERRRR